MQHEQMEDGSVNREPNGDAGLLNSDVDHFAAVVANLKARLDAAELGKAQMMLALVKGAGGRIEVRPTDLHDLPYFEVVQTVFQQTGAMIFEARRKLP